MGSKGYTDDFSEGIKGDRWSVYERVWGDNNNGVVPENVKLEKDDVNGITKNVVSFYCHGNMYDGNIKGVEKKKGGGFSRSDNNTRVGACLISNDYFASGTYEIDIKIPRDVSGMCTAFWSFHYEEHYCSPGKGKGNEINKDNPLYQPRHKLGSDDDGYYSTVNSEIDSPELGKNGDYSVGLFNTYTSETSCSVQPIKLPVDVSDEKYHRYSFEWATHLLPTTLTESDVVKHQGHFYVSTLQSMYQGQACVFTNNTWCVYAGKKVKFYFDGKLIGESSESVPCVSARMVVGVWFPGWAGKAMWKEKVVKLSQVKFLPLNGEGDVYFQPESFKDVGIVPAK
eukprot:GHVR01008966.1.p1 GENE.GHVR01008966.1~~GHVR01008966.1.p1  ORF type:complete len:340 (-),score=81.66 GHVR01008966.1:235-1254(-)